MRLKRIKRGLLCFILMLCMISGDLLSVSATGSEESVEQSTEIPSTESTEMTEESEKTPADTTEETEKTPTDTTEETEKTPTDTTEETEKTPADTTEETEKTPTGTTEETEKTPTDTTEETEKTPTDTTEETEKTPSDATEVSKKENPDTKLPEEEEEIPEEDFEEFLTSNPIQTFATSGVQTTALDAESKLEYTKKISKNADGTYKLTLTVKAPEVTPKDIVVVLDTSASMTNTFSDDDETTYMDAAVELIKDIRGAVKNDSSARMALVGFYGWAGKRVRTSDSLNFQPSWQGIKHGYDFPLYVDFNEMETDGFDIGARPAEGESKVNTGTDKTIPNIAKRSLIPDSLSLNAKVPKPDADSAADYQANKNGRYSVFFNTNWEAGLQAAADVLDGARSNADKLVVFITDGVPTTSMAGESLNVGTLTDMSGYEESGEALTKFCAAESVRSRSEIKDKNARIFSTLVGGTYTYMCYPTFGTSKLTNTQITTLSQIGMVSYNDDRLFDGQRTDVFELMKSQILDEYFNNVVITDQLTTEFEFISSNPNIAMTVTTSDGTITSLKKGDGVVESCGTSGKKITMTFADDYYLIPGATYTLSFDIKPSQDGYDNYAKVCTTTGYPDTGYPETDLDDSDVSKIISSGRKGYFTNTEDGAILTASKAGTTYEHEYPRPVAQIDLIDIPVVKEWVTNEETTSLANYVRVGLYQDGKLYKTAYLSKTAGYKATFTNVPPGHEYSVEEIVLGDEGGGFENYIASYSPESYATSTAAERATIQENGFTVTNTQLIPIKITKKWNVVDVPASLIVGVANEATDAQSADIATATLNASNNWSATVYVPYKTSGSYYIREYYSQPSGITVTTTAQRISTSGASNNMSVSTSYTGRRQVSLYYSYLSTISEIIFTNTEKLSITVGKTWNAGASSMPTKLSVTLTVKPTAGDPKTYSTTLYATNNWADKTISGIAYDPTATYTVTEATGNGTYYVSIVATNSAGSTVSNSGGIAKTSLILNATNFGKTKHVQFTNTEYMSIDVKKEWVTRSDTSLPTSLAIQLKNAKGTTTSENMTSSSSWSTSFTNIEYVKDGTYTISETTPTGYQASYAVYDAKEKVLASGKGSVCTLTADQLSEASYVKFTNTELISVTVEKIWNVYDTSLKPSTKQLTVGIGTDLSDTTDIATAVLTPVSTDSNTWSGTIEIPYTTDDKYYYIKEYWNPTTKDVTTTCRIELGTSPLTDDETTRTNEYYGIRYKYQQIDSTDLAKLTKITFTNTEMFEIEVEKQWSVIDSSLIPSSLTIGVGTSLAKSSDIATVTLTPAESGDMTWSGTIKVPYDPDISTYYFKEYYNGEFNGDNFYTKYIYKRSTSTGTSTTYGTAYPSTGFGCKYIASVTKDNFVKTIKVTFKNAQYINIPVEKRWNINTSSLIPENNQLTVRIGNSTTAYWNSSATAYLTPSTEDNNLWTGTINKVPYYADANYYVREIWNPASPPTTETVMESVDSDGNSVSLGTVTSNSTYREVSNVKGSTLADSEKIRITNTELISLTIEKQWVIPDEQTPDAAEIVVQALGSSNKVLKEYTFLLTESEPSVTREIPYNSDVISYVISEPEHSGYAVSYQVVKITGTNIEAAGDKVTILPSAISDVEKVVFTNTAENEITVRKEWIGEPKDSVTIAFAPSGELPSLESTVTLNAATQWKGTLKVEYDPDVNSYKIWENFSNAEDYNSTVKIGSKIYDGSSVDNLTYTELVNAGEIVFTNEKTGSLVVTKEVKGTYASPKEEFEITINLMDTSGNQSDYTKTITYGSPEKEVTFSKGEAIVSLKNGESIRITDIPIGYTYQVTEKSYDNYKVTYQVNGTETASVSGTISSNSLDQEVTVINTLEDIVVTGIFSDYSSSWMLLGIAFIGVISYVALSYKKKRSL